MSLSIYEVLKNIQARNEKDKKKETGEREQKEGDEKQQWKKKDAAKLRKLN